MLTTPHGRPAFATPVAAAPLRRAGNRVLADRHIRYRVDAPLSNRAALRAHAVTAGPDLGPDAEPLLRQLASSGVVIVAPDGTWPTVPTVPVLPATPFGLEAASVAARRTTWGAGLDAVPVSALVCSNRPSRLPGIIRQLDAQTHAALQIVIVAHGIELTPETDRALSDARDHGRATAVVTQDSAIVFGAALTAGALACDGTVVTKVDDDDVYGPQHITDLLTARRHSSAQLIGKAMQYVHMTEIDVSVRQDGVTLISEPEAYGTWVCGGTIAVDADLGRQLGWFDPLPRAVDRNLQDKVLRASGRIYRTHGLDYVYVRHGDGHTYATDWGKYLRAAIEQRPGVWPVTTLPTHPSRNPR